MTKLFDGPSSGTWTAVRASHPTPALGISRQSIPLNQSSNLLFWLVAGADGLVRSVHRSSAAQKMTEVPVVGEHVHTRVDAGSRPIVERHFARALTGEAFTGRFAVPDGEAMRHFEAAYVPLGAGSEVDSVAIVVSEVSFRIERDLERELLRGALDATEDGVMVCAAVGDMPLVFVNAAFLRLTGYAADEVLGKNPRFLADRDSPDESARTALKEAFTQGVPARVVLQNRRRDGTVFDNELRVSPVMGPDGRPHHWVGVMRNVTKQRAMEEQLRRAMAIDALGHLAGGAAHDFNNLLAAMTMELGYLRAVVDTPDGLESVAALEGCVQRSTTLVARLLAMTRPTRPEPTRVDLCALARDSERLLRRLVEADVELVVETASRPVWVFCDAQQIEQVWVNLVVNARDAMPNGGVITLRVMSDGALAHVEVSDEGVGMDAATQSKAFEPFFSTKGTRGTGLGLTTVRRIAEEHGGDVQVQSSLGRGARFAVRLPMLEDELPAVETEEALVTSELDALVGGHVLVVEDQDVLRRGIVRALERAGYRVSAARDGEEALVQLQETHVDVVLTDVVMPRMDGVELVHRILAARPEVRVLLMSGYSDPKLGDLPQRSKRVDFVAKPFRASSMLDKLRALMGDTVSAAP